MEYCCRFENLTYSNKSELDSCLPLKEQISQFCTLSDQPVTFNSVADWSLSGTADKISGTKLACHSRRSDIECGARWESGEKITSRLRRPQSLNTWKSLRPKRSYQKEQFHRRLTGHWYVILRMQTFFRSSFSAHLHSRSTVMYCRNVIKDILWPLNGDRRHVCDW